MIRRGRAAEQRTVSAATPRIEAQTDFVEEQGGIY